MTEECAHVEPVTVPHTTWTPGAEPHRSTDQAMEKAELSLPQLALRDLGLLPLLRRTEVTDGKTINLEHPCPSQASEQMRVMILSIEMFLSHSIFSFNHLFKR